MGVQVLFKTSTRPQAQSPTCPTDPNFSAYQFMAFRPSLICGVILFTACSFALKPISDDENLPVVDTIRDPVVALFDDQARPHDSAEPITEMQSSETEASASKPSDVN